MAWQRVWGSRQYTAQDRWAGGFLQAYRAAVRLDAHDVRAHLGIGKILLEAGRAGEALQAYRAAVRLDARSAGARLGMGDALIGTGRAGEACRRTARP